MTLAEFYAAVRFETAHDDDQQISDEDHLLPAANTEYRKLRRKLTARFPELFFATSDTTTLSGSSQNIAKPGNFERLERLERLDGSNWVPVPRAQAWDPERTPYLSFREHGANLVVGPVSVAPGQYRLVFITAPGCFPAADIPAGFMDVIIQKVCAKVQIRTGGDPAPHLREAEKTEKEMFRALANRMGPAPTPGFQSVYGDD